MTRIEVASLGYAAAEAIPLFHMLSGGSVVRVVVFAKTSYSAENCDSFNDLSEVYRLSAEGPSLKSLDSQDILKVVERWKASGLVFDVIKPGKELGELAKEIRSHKLKVGIKTPSLETLEGLDFLVIDYLKHCCSSYTYSGLDLDRTLRLAKELDQWVEVNTYLERPRVEDVLGEAEVTASYGFPLHVHLIEHEGGGAVRYLYNSLLRVNPYTYVHVDLYEQLNTYCPRCGSPVAYREDGALKSLELKDGTRCWKCGFELPFHYVISKKTSAQLLALSGGGTRWYDPRAVII
jgi:predicted RNA-binding Zn-ribbon protein involved in translation (DUF1610 family)